MLDIRRSRVGSLLDRPVKREPRDPKDWSLSFVREVVGQGVQKVEKCSRQRLVEPHRSLLNLGRFLGSKTPSVGMPYPMSSASRWRPAGAREEGKEDSMIV